MSGSCHEGSRIYRKDGKVWGRRGINDKLSAPVNDQESGTCVRTYLDLGELGFYYTENVQYKAGWILFVCAPTEQLFPCHTQANISPAQIRWHQTPLFYHRARGRLLSAQHDQYRRYRPKFVTGTFLCERDGKKTTDLMVLESPA